jgi:hypothetical protein
MKRSYNNINPSFGPYSKGICKILIAPREWVQDAIIKDFETGKVVDAIILTDARQFIELQFTPESYSYEEKPKGSKAGSYYEISLEGIANNITAETLLTLETLRHHEFVAIIFTKDNLQKLVGDNETGLRLVFGNKEDDNKQVLSIAMAMENECMAPVYEV